MKQFRWWTSEDMKDQNEQDSHPGQRIHWWIQALGKRECISLHSEDIRNVSDYAAELEKRIDSLETEVSKLRLDLGWLNKMPT